MNKSDSFTKDQIKLAQFARAISHPARLSIIQYLAETKTCISGDISDSLPLSRSTVSQHLKALRDIGLIHGNIEGLKINYCLCHQEIEKFSALFNGFFEPVKSVDIVCATVSKPDKAKIEELIELGVPDPQEKNTDDIFFF